MERFLKYIIVFTLFVLTSCREDVITPNNPVGQKNTPVKSNSSKLYTFVIDANNYTVKIKDEVAFQSSAFMVTARTSYHESGSVRVSLISENGNPIITETFSRNKEFQDVIGFNNLPAYIEVQFFEFTGVFNIEIYSIILG
jgi:hypothetical protein